MQAASEDALLLRVEEVKFRNTDHGKSPVGTVFIYQNRIVWKAGGSDVTTVDLVIHYNEITCKYSSIQFSLNVFLTVSFTLAQKKSARERSKVMWQILLGGEKQEQATFVFQNPKSTHDSLITERDNASEVLRKALVRYRELQHEVQEREASKAAADETRKKALMNPHLFAIYKELVVKKFIPADDFWKLHLVKEVSKFLKLP